MKLWEIMRNYQSLNSVQPVFKSQSSFIYGNQVEDIFSLNILANLLSSRQDRKVFDPRDEWYLSSYLFNEISQPLVSISPRLLLVRLSPHCQILFSDWSIPRHTSSLSSHWLLGCALSPADTDSLAFSGDKMRSWLAVIIFLFCWVWSVA